jgi:UDP-glucose 4-epimerase
VSSRSAEKHWVERNLTLGCAQAKQELGWTATRDLDTMCRDLWRFQQVHFTAYDCGVTA